MINRILLNITGLIFKMINTTFIKD